MANEATLVFRKTLPVPMTVANGNGIEKGAILRLVDPFTVSGSVVVEGIIGGIAASEKIASDGKTKLGVYRGPGDIFKVTLSGSCDVGDPLALSGTQNMVKSARGITDASLSGSKIIGTALETGVTGDTILMELNIQSQGAG